MSLKNYVILSTDFLPAAGPIEPTGLPASLPTSLPASLPNNLPAADPIKALSLFVA